MTSALMQRLGKTIRIRREKAGYTQEDFAALVGMHRTYYSAVERGTKNVQLETVDRICRGLKCKMWELLKEVES